MSLHALTVAGGPHALQMQTTHLLAAPRCPAGFCSIVAPERPLSLFLFVLFLGVGVDGALLPLPLLLCLFFSALPAKLLFSYVELLRIKNLIS